MKIPIAKTEFLKEDYENIIKPLKSGWVVQGHFVSEFENKWSKFTNSKNSIAVSSCTTALHLSLAALGIKPGDEVIVPSFTWIATVNVIEYLYAKPVFCDIDINTFNIDVEKIEQLITKNTKAIIPVHLFGLPVNMDVIKEIAEKYKILIIEDSACGLGAKYNGVHTGNFGNTGCFSFHPRKALTTGEGGMITTNDKSLAKKLRAMRDHGASVSDLTRHLKGKPYLLPDFPYLGYNYRMTDIQASIGSSQMNRVNDILEKRKNIANIYINAFKNIDWLKKPFTDSNYTNGFQSFVCLFETEKIKKSNVAKVNAKRNKFMEYLFRKGISTRPGTHAVHNQYYYKKKYGLRPEYLLNSYIAEKCSVSLPIFPSLSNNELDYIIESIIKYKI